MAKHEAPRPSVKKGTARSSRRAPIWAAAALAGILAVGGSIAFLTDETEGVENAFQPAEVTCAVMEDFDGSVKSDVKVKNTGDVDAYIRAAVVVNWVDGQGNVGPESPVPGTDYSIIFETEADDPWTKVGDYYYYEGSVAMNGTTEPLISECEQLTQKDGYSLRVDILSSAIQSEPADAVQEAWGVNISGGAVTSVSQGN